MAKKKSKPEKKRKKEKSVEKMLDDADLTSMDLDELHEYLLDFDGIADEDTIPAGKYHVAVVEAQVEQGAKAPYLALRMKILTGEYKDSGLWHNLTFSPKPFPRRRLKQAAIAFLGEDLGKISPLKLAKLLVGKTAVVATGQEEYEGEMRAKVKRFMPYKSGQKISATTTDDGLDELFDDDEDEEDYGDEDLEEEDDDEEDIEEEDDEKEIPF